MAAKSKPKPRTAKSQRASARTSAPAKTTMVPATASAGLEDLVVRLTAACDGLAATQSSFEAALFRMPHPDDYEPLAEPMRSFARVSPQMIEILQDVQRRLAPVPPAPSAAARQRLQDALADLETARRTVHDAVSALPADKEYAGVARQLRELASVSPSLLEWLQEVPKLSAPLASSARGLLETTALLESAGEQIQESVRELWPDLPPANS